VEATVQALLHTIDEGTPVKFHPHDVSKEIPYLKLGKHMVCMPLEINVSGIFQEDCCAFITFI
jgi:hypothetical protein